MRNILYANRNNITKHPTKKQTKKIKISSQILDPFDVYFNVNQFDENISLFN